MGKLISVIGNSGVGKTALARALADQPGFELALEDHPGRPFQQLFKQDLQRYSLANQIDYLLLRAEQERDLRSMAEMGVLDGGLDLDFEVFTRLFHQKGYLTRPEFELCQRLYVQLRLCLPAPDLYLYLKAPLPVIHARFLRRGRPLEIASPDDLLEIQQFLDQWLSPSRGLPLIEIDVSQEDPGFACLLPDLAARIRARFISNQI
mgnify:CR=1 FL=1